jgi:DNA-binding winged helix-turn-helix (wHTH) protein
MRFLVGPLVVDSDRLAVFEGARSLPIPPKVVEILIVLCEQAGAFVGKDTLLERLWPGGDVDDSVLWQKVYLARKTLAPYLGPDAIETLPRRGYRLTVAVNIEPAEVTRPVASAPPAAIAWPRRRYALMLAGATALMLVLIVASWTRTAVAPPVALDASAMRAYNLGRYFLSLRNYDSTRKAEREFATVTASKNRGAAALGYAGLADVHAFISSVRRDRGATDELRAARRAAETALRLDPHSAEASTALGSVLLWGDLRNAHGGRLPEDDAARNAFVAAVAQNPSYAPGELAYGKYLLLHGELEAATEYLQRTVDLDPSDAAANLWLARATYTQGDARAAQSYAARAIAFKTSDEEDAFATLGLAYARERRYDDALNAFRALGRYAPSQAEVLIAYVEAAQGAHAQSVRRLNEAIRRSCDCGGDFWMNVALTQSLLGNRVAAAASLERMARSMHGEAQFLASDPRLTAARNDPRLRGMLNEAFGA